MMASSSMAVRIGRIKISRIKISTPYRNIYWKIFENATDRIERIYFSLKYEFLLYPVLNARKRSSERIDKTKEKWSRMTDEWSWNHACVISDREFPFECTGRRSRRFHQGNENARTRSVDEQRRLVEKRINANSRASKKKEKNWHCSNQSILVESIIERRSNARII